MALMLDDDYPEILAAAARAAYAWMTEHLKMDHQPAAEAAFAIAEAIRTEVGGAYEYIPKGQTWMLSRRDRDLYAKFRGDNYRQLAREYQLSEMRVRQIVERCRAADIQARQAGLF
jgi:Mor family transcriptional regulator